MLEYALPVAASVFFTLFLRRLDKSNVNLKKIKAIAERAERELGDLTLKKKEELKDAKNRVSFYIGTITGFKKTRFNGLDFGVIAVDTASANPNPAIAP